MTKHFVSVLLLLAICSSLLAVSEIFLNGQKRTLVVVDTKSSQQSSHSEFLKLLEKKGYKLTIKKARDSSISLTSYGEPLYDNVLILATSEDLGGELSAKSLSEFVESGHNVLIAASSKVTESLREFVSEMGVELEEDQRYAIDHFYFDSALDESYGSKHTLVVAQNINPVMKTKKPILFNGLAMTVDRKNHFLVPFLTGSSTTYCFNPTEEIDSDVVAVGKKTVLVAGYQSKTKGARVTVVGSAEMLSNKLLDASVTQNGKATESGNKEFANELIKWAFQEKGFLRHREVHHYKKGEKTTPANYRISEDLVYSVIIEEYNGETNQWQPFVADDIQIEFIMLDPYIRTLLTHVGDGKYTVEFRTPDVYGVYKFKVDYRRTGYTPLVFSDQVVVRPMRINEYERYIPAAFPYYASTFSMMFAFFLFGFLFLYTSEKTKQE